MDHEVSDLCKWLKTHVAKSGSLNKVVSKASKVIKVSQ